MEAVQAAMTANLGPDQCRNRDEWCMVSGRQQQLLKYRTDGWMDGWILAMCSYI